MKDRLLEQQTSPQDLLSIVLTRRAKGIYLLKVHTQQGTAVRKLVRM